MLGTSKARRINSILRAFVHVYDPSITGMIGRLALMTGIVVFYDLRRVPEKRNATWVLEKEYVWRKRAMWNSIRCGIAGIGERAPWKIRVIYWAFNQDLFCSTYWRFRCMAGDPVLPVLGMWC